jgi:hypothetical protein
MKYKDDDYIPALPHDVVKQILSYHVIDATNYSFSSETFDKQKVQQLVKLFYGKFPDTMGPYLLFESVIVTNSCALLPIGIKSLQSGHPKKEDRLEEVSDLLSRISTFRAIHVKPSSFFDITDGDYRWGKQPKCDISNATNLTSLSLDFRSGSRYRGYYADKDLLIKALEPIANNIRTLYLYIDVWDINAKTILDSLINVQYLSVFLTNFSTKIASYPVQELSVVRLYDQVQVPQSVRKLELNIDDQGSVIGTLNGLKDNVNLHHLVLSGETGGKPGALTMKIITAALALSQVTILEVRYADVKQKNVLQAIGKSTTLRSVTISDCNYVNDANLVLAQYGNIREINIHGDTVSEEATAINEDGERRSTRLGQKKRVVIEEESERPRKRKR